MLFILYCICILIVLFSGYSYLYNNDVMVKSYNHGSHQTKMGPMLSIMEYGNPDHL